MRGIKKKTLEHYTRMIAWAKEQDPIEFADILKMEKSLGESWDDDNCAFCTEFGNDQWRPCPLQPIDRPCWGVNCCDGLWSDLNNTETWHDWIKVAKQVKAFIKKTRLDRWE